MPMHKLRCSWRKIQDSYSKWRINVASVTVQRASVRRGRAFGISVVFWDSNIQQTCGLLLPQETENIDGCTYTGEV
jgi:hypothetical protein